MNRRSSLRDDDVHAVAGLRRVSRMKSIKLSPKARHGHRIWLRSALAAKVLSFCGCFFLCLLIATTQKALANVPPSMKRAAEELSRQVIDSQIGGGKKTVGEWIWKEIEAYDLTKEARNSYEGLADNDAFLKFLEKRGVDVDKAGSSNMTRLMLEYMGSSTNFRPAIVSWLTLIFGFEAPWETAHPLYLKIAAERTNDFLPKAVALIRAVRTTEAEEQWFTLFKQTYTGASNPKERSLCLILLPSHAFRAAAVPGSDGHLRQISDWLDDLEKKETADRLPAIREINFIKFFVAFVRKDYVSAARLAEGSRVRALEPLLLIMAGKLDEAGTILERLKQDATMTPQEMGLLNSTAGILQETEGAGAK
jgi:hypothetical protein